MKTQPIEATETSHSENLDTYQTFLSFMHTPEDVTGEDKRGRRNRFVLVAIAFFLYFQKNGKTA